MDLPAKSGGEFGVGGFFAGADEVGCGEEAVRDAVLRGDGFAGVRAWTGGGVFGIALWLYVSGRESDVPGDRVQGFGADCFSANCLRRHSWLSSFLDFLCSPRRAATLSQTRL